MVASIILNSTFIYISRQSKIVVDEQLLDKLFKENITYHSLSKNLTALDTIDYDLHHKSFLNHRYEDKNISKLQNTINNVLVLDKDAELIGIINRFRDVLNYRSNWDKLSSLDKFFFIYLIACQKDRFDSISLTNFGAIKNKFQSDLAYIGAFNLKSLAYEKLQLYLLIVNCK